jgi:hypothetical protein
MPPRRRALTISSLTKEAHASGVVGGVRQVLIVLSSSCIAPTCISADANMAEMRRMQDVEPCAADQVVTSDPVSACPD